MILFFLIYQLIQIPLFPLLLIFLLLRKIRGKTIFGSFKQRFGFVIKAPSNKKVFWIHAVSVGETLSIQNTISKIKKKFENSFCYMTVGTLSAKKIAEQKKIGDVVSFIPYDLIPSMLIAFKRIHPRNIIIVEADTWPNLLMLANFMKIPTYIINARINDKSKNKYKKLKFAYKLLLNTCMQIYTQSKKDTNELIALGINKNKLTTMGNIKTPNVLNKRLFMENKKKAQAQNINLNFSTILIGSIHPGELSLYIDLFNNLKRKFTNLKLIIAPRHFNWKRQLLEKLDSSSLSYIIWKEHLKNIEVIEKLKSNDILLVLKLGELFNLYQFCDIFFLGGTFVPIGGHNLLEPAVWGKPSIIGPYYSNSKVDADNLEKAGGLIKVKNKNELLTVVENLLRDKSYKQIGENGYKWLLNESKVITKRLNNFVDMF